MSKLQFLLLLTAAFGGGLLGNYVLPRPSAVEAQKSDTVTAREFVLSDKAGITRARLSANDDGVALEMMDTNGKPQWKQGVGTLKVAGEVDSYLTLMNSNGKVVAHLRGGGTLVSTPGGKVRKGASLMLRDDSDVNRIMLVGDDSSAEISLQGSQGRIELDSNPNGQSLLVKDSTSQNRLEMSLAKDGAASLILRDKEGKTTWSQSSR